MMIPPLVRVGPVPAYEPLRSTPVFVVLTRNGWSMARWSLHHLGATPRLMRIDAAVAIGYQSYIEPTDVLCWMSADGS